MAAYYNEHDKFAAQWLRNLIAEGHIAPGEVDERDIQDVKADDLKGFTQCHFFAGIGGWSVALRYAGWEDDKHVWTGSCPCQPLSSAGHQKGHADDRHLWPAFFNLISEQRPTDILGEQVASKLGREWYSGVRADLECVGYASGAADLPAPCVGAPHIRPRLWWCATDNYGTRLPKWDEPGNPRTPSTIFDAWSEFKRVHAACAWASREDQSDVRVFVDGIRGRVGQVRGYGNAIPPALAAEFIRAYTEVICEL